MLYPTNFTYAPPPDFQKRVWAANAQADFEELFGKRDPSRQFVYGVYAGTGAGKTKLVAALACSLFNQRIINRLVYVCPNLLIAAAVQKEFRDDFKIYLARWSNRKHKAEGEGRGMQGCVLTYQSLLDCVDMQRRINRQMADVRTLVVFDEFHHLGDQLAWGQAAEAAFKGRDDCHILLMSGTPYRSDDNQFPFRESLPCYTADDGSIRLRFHYTYTLGQAIVDNHCRRPVFVWSNAKMTTSAGETSFSDGMPIDQANELLRCAVHHQSPARMELLHNAYRLVKEEGRRIIVFLGGDTSSSTTPTHDAINHLPEQLRHVGFAESDIAIVTSHDRDAMARIKQFDEGKGKVLGTVNMVSEGVSIPSLSGAVFLTNITAPSTTAQRIGRVLRLGPDGNGIGPILMFRHPSHARLASDIECEITLALQDAARKETPQTGGRGGFKRQLDTALVSHFPDGQTVNKVWYTQQQREGAISVLRSRGFPVTEALITVYLDLQSAKSGGAA